jgi:peptidyl-prolyl cis-trans isomerase C
VLDRAEFRHNLACFKALKINPEKSMSFFPRRSALARLALPISLAAGLALPAFAQDTAAPAEASPPEAAAPAQPAPVQPDPDKVVATIEGQPVTEADLAMALASVDQQYSQLPPEQRRAAAFMAVMEVKLLAARAIAEGLDKDPEFQRRMAFLRDRALHSEVIEKDVGAKITDEEIRARYDKQLADTPPVNEVKARHILVKTKEEAEAIVKQLDGGAKFEDLAAQHTTDPSGKTTGGDLGYFAPGQMVPEFEKAAFALNVGEYSKEPVQSQFGWHIIMVEDKRAQQPPAFDSVKDEVRNLVFREKYFAMVEDLRKAAKVDVTDPELKKAVDAMEQTEDQQQTEEPQQ